MSESDGGRPSIETLLRHRRVALDANVLIALLEDPTRRGEAAARILDAIDEGTLEGVAATIVVTEVLSGPARAGDATGFELLADQLREASLRYVPVSIEVAEDAAWLRTGRALSFPDALHLAAARAAGATAFVTNDRRIRSTQQLEVVYLDDLVAETDPVSGA